jgi:hypothetical protein
MAAQLKLGVENRWGYGGFYLKLSTLSTALAPELKAYPRQVRCLPRPTHRDEIRHLVQTYMQGRSLLFAFWCFEKSKPIIRIFALT